MKLNPAKKKTVNNQSGNDITQRNANAGNEKKDIKPKFTSDDLKGKKVDGDPSLQSDQPIKQAY